jgi:hypothetical protein
MIVRTARWETTCRYYELYEGEDLFGQPVLVQVWGGKGNARGRSRTLTGTVQSLALMKQAVGALRRRHGYMMKMAGG